MQNAAHHVRAIEERINGPRADIQHRWVCACGEAGPWLKQSTEQASRTILVHVNQATSQENKTMATDKSANKSTPSTKPAPAAPAKPVSAAEAKSDKPRVTRVWLMSQLNPELIFKVRTAYLEKYGYPEHGGKPMVIKQMRGGGQADPNKAAEKAAREAKLKAMTEEQRAEFLKAERETRKVAKAARKEEELAALKAKLRAELEAELAAKK